MRVERKIVRPDVFGGLGVGSVIEQDRAQDGLFRVDIRGQSGIESEVGDRGHEKSVGQPASHRPCENPVR